MTAPIVHPAPFSPPILELLRELIPDGSLVLDPFAGIGRIHCIADPVRDIRTIGVEIEPEWAAMHPCSRQGDATDLDFFSGTFDVVATSPCYGNRFADAHDARDGSRRRSYTHDLRAFTGDPERKLADNNAGAMQWGEPYRELHRQAWAEVWRVLKPGGLFLLNISDHVRARRLQGVPAWHRETIEALGFDHLATHEVTTRRQKHGENRERADYEEVQTYRKRLGS